MRTPPSAGILVVGAGPTGLALALQAHAHGANVRIVERRREAFRPSRAMIMHPRTLEVLRPLGVTDALLAKADVSPAVELHLGSRIVHVRLADLALPDTAFPHLSLLRQMDIESILITALAARGVAVERETEVVEVRSGDGEASAVLRSPNGLEHVACGAIAGCDGPHSVVRRAACFGWEGGTYREEIVLADVNLDADIKPGMAHAVVGSRGLLFLFALGEYATWRLLATRPAGSDAFPFGEAGPAVPVVDLQALLYDAGLKARIIQAGWSGRYRVQHRRAARFMHGRLFLAGDAAHAFSPATGQGMNVGIQDALNLGWKLAFAPASSDPDTLLASYERERRPAVGTALAMTHVAFWFEASTSLLPAFIRGVLAPLGAGALPLLMRQRRLVALGLRQAGQLSLSYRHSALSLEGSPRLMGWPRPGQRLPDATVEAAGQLVRLHALLACPGVHILLQRDARELFTTGLAPRVAVHRLTGTPGTGVLGIRPDGYVGYSSARCDPDKVLSWLASIGAVPDACECR